MLIFLILSLPLFVACERQYIDVRRQGTKGSSQALSMQ